MTTVPQTFGLALRSHREGHLQQAAQLYQQVLQVNPQHVNALHLLGLIFYQVGKYELASSYIRQAVCLEPRFAEAHHNLGGALLQQGKLEEAMASYQQALRLKPTCAEAHNNLGNILRQQGKLAEAVDRFQQALRLKPTCAEAHNNLGVALSEQGQLAEAVAHFQQALRLQPNYAEAHNNLGNVLQEQGQLAEALASYQQTLRLAPTCAEGHTNLGAVLCDLGKLDEAVACHQQALRLKPSHAQAYHNLGVAFRQQGKLAEALASYQQALRLNPHYADAHYNLGMTWLLLGNFEQGWPEHEWRVKCKKSSRPHLAQPLWDGSPLDGRTILLHAEQGLGDTLHFIRYAPLAKERGGRVLVVCQPALLQLLSRCPGIDQLLPEGSPLPPFDVQAPLLSLPAILGTALATVPAPVPYVFAQDDLLAHWEQELTSIAGFKIGIAWQGNPKYQRDRARSIPLVHFEPLARLEGVRLVSLQKGHGSEQLPQVAERFPVLDLGNRLDERGGAFLDTAAVLQHLDLVITSDTALAHLAGALGVPVWVALPFAPDWRWLLERADSPWYPTMRLFRQSEEGDWPSVFAHLTEAVEQRLRGEKETQLLPLALPALVL